MWKGCEGRCFTRPVVDGVGTVTCGDLRGTNLGQKLGSSGGRRSLSAMTTSLPIFLYGTVNAKGRSAPEVRSGFAPKESKSISWEAILVGV